MKSASQIYEEQPWIKAAVERVCNPRMPEHGTDERAEMAEKDRALLAAIKWMPAAGLLTEREQQVLDLDEEGLRDHEIADRLGLGVETVKTYLKHARAKGNQTVRELTVEEAVGSADCVTWACTGEANGPDGLCDFCRKQATIDRKLHEGTIRPCRFPGCENLVERPDTLCEGHRSPMWLRILRFTEALDDEAA